MRFIVKIVQCGQVRPLGPKGVPSGIVKAPASGAVRAAADGLEGDQQADLRNHGGVDKAVHAYPSEHYPAWRADLPERAERLVEGAFGENLVIAGATEADVCLGDVVRVGAALFELSQGRQPCWKLNLRFEQDDMARRVQATGRTGWYYRVREPGALAAGDAGALVERPHAAWPLSRVTGLLYHKTGDRDGLAEMAALPGLPDGWRRLAEARLASGRVEDWSRRLGDASDA